MPIIDYNSANPFLPNQGIGGNFYNRTFSDVFPDADAFESAYLTSGLYDPDNAVSKISLVYYLLYSYYGNSVIASYDENRFQYNVFTIMFMYGPSWETKLKAQSKIRELLDKEEDLLAGSISVHNHSFNPSTEPANDAFDALTTINDQNASKWKKSKLEGYASLMAVLKNDVSAEFIDKFKHLFLTIVEPNAPLWYDTTPEEQEILEV